MSKRQNTTALEINNEAKRMAIAHETNRLLMDANRQRRNEARPAPKCYLCRADHHSTECDSYLQDEKMAVAKERKLCLICVTPRSHHPLKCKILRDFEQLCKNRACTNAYTVHHKTICDKNVHPIAAPNAQQENDNQDDE